MQASAEPQQMIFRDLDKLQIRINNVFDTIDVDINEIEQILIKIQKNAKSLRTLKNGLVLNHGQQSNIFQGTLRKSTRNCLMSKWTNTIEVSSKYLLICRPACFSEELFSLQDLVKDSHKNVSRIAEKKQEISPVLNSGILATDSDTIILKKSYAFGKQICGAIQSLMVNADYALIDGIYKKLLKVQQLVAVYRKNLDELRNQKLSCRPSDSTFSTKYKNREMTGTLKSKIQVRTYAECNILKFSNLTIFIFRVSKLRFQATMKWTTEIIFLKLKKSKPHRVLQPIC